MTDLKWNLYYKDFSAEPKLFFFPTKNKMSKMDTRESAKRNVGCSVL